jgi:hypothetical protein
MTLQICVSPCALAGADDLMREFPDSVVRGSPYPAHAATEGLQVICADDLPPCVEPPEVPDDDGEWEEFDSATLERWILDDFDWDVEESYPQRGDYWDDSLDGEWDLAATINVNRDRFFPSYTWCSYRVPTLRGARQSLASSVLPGGAWEQALSPVPCPPVP